MKRLLVLISILLTGCGSSPNKPSTPFVLTEIEHRDQYIGQLVTIRGEVFNSKQATILGIDVESDDPDLREHVAQATGILEKYVVTQKELDDRQKNGEMIQTRGPGTFYRLRKPNSDFEAAVEPLAP